jgi:deoxyribonuclease V
MKIHPLHDWDVTPTEAVALQRELSGRVVGGQPLKEFDLVAGCDVSHNRFSNALFAGVVVWRASDGQVVERTEASGTTAFPYIPGLLTFREAPVLLQALAKVRSEPDVVMIDGQGYAHPRRFGIACHLGLWLDRPTLGCAKSRLCGEYKDPRPAAGSTSPLVAGHELIGQVVRTKDRVNPLFVSIAHRIDLASAVWVVLDSCRGYRVPEPTRQAHLHVNEVRRAAALGSAALFDAAGPHG